MFPVASFGDFAAFLKMTHLFQWLIIVSLWLKWNYESQHKSLISKKNKTARGAFCLLSVQLCKFSFQWSSMLHGCKCQKSEENQLWAFPFFLFSQGDTNQDLLVGQRSGGADRQQAGFGRGQAGTNWERPKTGQRARSVYAGDVQHENTGPKDYLIITHKLFISPCSLARFPVLRGQRQR